MTAGTVTALWRHPVKSMAGEPVRSMRVDRRGAGGDRTHAVWFEHKGRMRQLTAREAPRLLAWRAEYPFAPDAGLDPDDPPPAHVVAPDGRRFAWADPRLRRRLEEDLGRAVELRRDPAGQQDLPDSLLVTCEASRRALEAEMGAPVDVRRFRTNVHLDLDAAAWEELRWEGGTVTLAGGVVLRLLHPCERCAIPGRDPATQDRWPELLRHLHRAHGNAFGINARVEVPGRIAVGQAVQVAVPALQ